jgi:hypothetical protein
MALQQVAPPSRIGEAIQHIAGTGPADAWSLSALPVVHLRWRDILVERAGQGEEGLAFLQTNDRNVLPASPHQRVPALWPLRMNAGRRRRHNDLPTLATGLDQGFHVGQALLVDTRLPLG